MNKHTPTPWSFCGERITKTTEDLANGRIHDAPIAVFATTTDAQHAQRCVNAHDELVAALEALCKATHPLPVSKRYEHLKKPFFSAYTRAKDVLAEVQGEQS